jgi:hypothetical protein
MVLCLPINVVEKSLTSIHFLCKIVVPSVLSMPFPEWAACPKEGMTLVNLALGDCVLLVWVTIVILPVPLLAQATVWPGGASVISVADPITIVLTVIVLTLTAIVLVLTAIVLVLLFIFESGTMMIPPLVLLVWAFYSCGVNSWITRRRPPTY